MNRIFKIICLFIFMVGISFQAEASEKSRFDMGLRGGTNLADGEPANDMPWFGVYGHYRLSDNYLLGIGLDNSSFDFERPAKLLNINYNGTVDADANLTTLSFWVEREYDLKADKLMWFWSAGIGVGFVDVDDATGPIVGGGQYNIKTDANTEVIPGIGLGLRWHLNRTFAITSNVRFEYHVADWDVKDQVSGIKGSVDNYLTSGIFLGMEVFY